MPALTHSLAAGDRVRIMTHDVPGSPFMPRHHHPHGGAVGMLVHVPTIDAPAVVELKVGERSVFSAAKPYFLDLVERGPGFYQRGVSPELARHERFIEFSERALAACDDLPSMCGGFKNPATLWARDALAGNAEFMAQLPALRMRWCGKLGVRKARSVFKELGLVVPEGVLACPVPVPDEFKGWVVRGLAEKLAVDWAQVAAEFRGPRKSLKDAA